MKELATIYTIDNVISNIWNTIQDIILERPRSEKKGYFGNLDQHCFSNSAKYLASRSETNDILVLLGRQTNHVLHSIVTNPSGFILSDTTQILGGKVLRYDRGIYKAIGHNGLEVEYKVLFRISLINLVRRFNANPQTEKDGNS